jgi:hypothetical protein
MKRRYSLSLALLMLVVFGSSALALMANQPYSVQLLRVSAGGQQQLISQMEASTDAGGKLDFSFANLPDAGTAPFLMVQILDNSSGQAQILRQTLVPAPTAGEQMQMGVSETTFRQTQAALHAMQGATDARDATQRIMFPLTMISSGGLSAEGAESFGQAAAEASVTLNDFLARQGVTGEQMTSFQDALTAAMRTFAAGNKMAVEQQDMTDAAGIYGRTAVQFIDQMVQAGVAAGIDPMLMTTALDQATRTIDDSSALSRVSMAEIAALHATLIADAQQRRVYAQLSSYHQALPAIGAKAGQLQDFTGAMNTLENAMVQTHANFCQTAFADPSTLPDQATIDQALSEMKATMQGALDSFGQKTTATSTQIDGALTLMADDMGGAGGMGGLISGGMMTGANLSQMGFGMMPTSPDGTEQNWSTMMVAATNLLTADPNMSYTPTAGLINQLSVENRPSAPDWSLLPDGAAKSLLELQYDLMLAHLIDMQSLAGMSQPPSLADMAALSATALAHHSLVSQGLHGLSAARMNALPAALRPPMLSVAF